MSMFCYQCQETVKGIGCTVKGVCGKTEDVAKLQDLLIYTIKGVSKIVAEGKIDIKELGIDAFSASFHKFHGPKGLGLCYINSNIPYTKQIHGGEHEMNKRSGTENLNSIILGFEVYKYMNENIEKNRKI